MAIAIYRVCRRIYASHMSRQDYQTGYVVVAATVPDHVRMIEHLRYRDSKTSDAARERTAGDQWLQSGESASYEFLQPWSQATGTT